MPRLRPPIRLQVGYFFGARGGGCGSQPSSDLIPCTFSIFSLSEPSWNHVAPDFGPFSGPFWEIFSCSETVFGGSFRHAMRDDCSTHTATHACHAHECNSAFLFFLPVSEGRFIGICANSLTDHLPFLGRPRAVAHQSGRGFSLSRKSLSSAEICPSLPGQRFSP